MAMLMVLGTMSSFFLSFCSLGQTSPTFLNSATNHSIIVSPPGQRLTWDFEYTPLPTAPCQSWTSNADFENGTVTKTWRNIATYNSTGDARYWWSPNGTSSDYFKQGAPLDTNFIGGFLNMGVPLNFMTRRARYGQSHSGGGYAGIAAFPAGAYPGNPEYREYVAQIFDDSIASGDYYAEFYSRPAELAGKVVPSLGLWLGDLQNDVRFYSGGNTVSTGVMRGNNGRRLVPQITRNDGHLNDSSGWSRTAGCMRAPRGQVSGVIVGCFLPDSACAFTASPFPPHPYYTGFAREAYYFIEDVQLRLFPTAGPNVAVTCGTVILGDGCALPGSSGAVYLWFAPGADPAIATPLQVSTTLTAYLVPPTAPSGLYTMVVRVPHPDRTYNPLDPTTYYQAVSDALVQRLPYTMADAGGPYTFGVGQTPRPRLTGTPTGGTWTSLGGGLILTPSGYIQPRTPAGAFSAVYTYTDPATGCTSSDTATVRMVGCELSQGFDVDLTPYIQNGPLTQNIFQPNTRYYIPADVELELETDDFVLPSGCVLLFDGNKSRLIVGQGAHLTIAGATLTAACEEMWHGIRVTNLSRGIRLEASPIGSPSDPDADDTDALPTRYNHILHASLGIQIAAPGVTPWHIAHTEFAHNLEGVVLNYDTASSSNPIQPVKNGRGYIKDCDFWSDSLLFKAPHARQGQVSIINVVTGRWDVTECPITGNRFRQTLIGLHSISPVGAPTGRVQVGAPDGGNRFACVLAGILLQSSRGGHTLTDNHFSLPNRNLRPACADATIANLNLSALAQQAVGVWVADATTGESGMANVVARNTFEQYQSVASLQSVGAFAPMGLWLEPGQAAYRVLDNTFVNLKTGVKLVPRYATAVAEIGANDFRHCSDGILVSNDGPASGSTTPIVWLRCNSFVRSSTTAPGRMNALHLTAQTQVLLDDPGSTTRYTTMMKNRFLIEPSALFNTRFIYNENVNTLPVYTAFKELDPTDPAAIYPINFKTEIQTKSVNVDVEGRANPNSPGSYSDILYKDAFSCTRQDLITNAGFNPLRGVNASPTVVLPSVVTVSQNNPNPFSDETTIAYQLSNTLHAELIVRDVLTGQVMKHLTLDVKAPAVQLSATGLQPGVYVYSVIADGVTVATRRLLISR